MGARGLRRLYILQEMLTVKSDDVNGRTKVYENIVKGEHADRGRHAGVVQRAGRRDSLLGIDIELERN